MSKTIAFESKFAFYTNPLDILVAVNVVVVYGKNEFFFFYSVFNLLKRAADSSSS